MDPDAVTRALAAVDRDAVADDLARLGRVESGTGAERAAGELVAELAEARGLAGAVTEHDLVELRRSPAYPGEEAPRSELVGATATLAGSGRRRLCLNGHVDVVAAGAERWEHEPF